MATGDLSSERFVPANLRSRDLFRRSVEIMDGVACDVYSPHLGAVLHSFDPYGEGFDAEALLSSMGGPVLADLIIGRRPQVSDIDPATDQAYTGSADPAYLAALGAHVQRSARTTHILPRLFNLKGTRRGLSIILGLAGISTREIVGWEVWRGYLNSIDSDNHSPGPVTAEAPQGAYAKAFSDFSRSFPSAAAALDQDSRDGLACKVYFTVGLSGAGGSDGSGTDRDERILDVVRRFMPICAQAVIEVTSNIATDPESRRTTDVGPDDAGMRIRARMPEDDGLTTRPRVSDLAVPGHVNYRFRPARMDYRHTNNPSLSLESGHVKIEVVDSSASLSDSVRVNDVPFVYGVGFRHAGPRDIDPIRHSPGGADQRTASAYGLLSWEAVVNNDGADELAAAAAAGYPDGWPTSG